MEPKWRLLGREPQIKSAKRMRRSAESPLRSRNAFGIITEHAIHSQRFHAADILGFVHSEGEHFYPAPMCIRHQFRSDTFLAGIHRPRAQTLGEFCQLTRNF